MKKAVALFILLLLTPFLSDAATSVIKLRTNLHSDFLRIVLEGSADIINEALVHQRGGSVVVNFPDADFTVQMEKIVIEYKRLDRRTFLFNPGNFRGLKVFTLKHPDRLVIDVYLKKGEKSYSKPIVPPAMKDTPSFQLQGEKRVPVIGRVVIDPGHGGYDSGIIQGEFREKNVVLDIARKLSALINKGKARSTLTRGSDRFMSQAERVRLANEYEAEIFISLHIGTHAGMVIYYPVVSSSESEIVRPHLAYKGQLEHAAESESLSRAMKEALMSNFDAESISVRPLPYSILSRIAASALIVELPSFEDARYIEELKEEIADTLFKGIYLYEEVKAN